MEKTFVNPLAYSRILKLVMIGALIFVVIVDVLVVFLLVKVSDYATPEERERLLWLVVPLLLSSVTGFPLFYFIHRTIREQWIETSDQGIRYNSLGKKLSASWAEVISVSIVSRGRYGQALRTKGLLIDTSKGKIYALPTFVDKSEPIPQLRMGISSQRLLYPNGRTRKVDVETSDVYAELQNYVPELFGVSSGQQA